MTAVTVQSLADNFEHFSKGRPAATLVAQLTDGQSVNYRSWRRSVFLARNGMAAMARTSVLPEATGVGALSTPDGGWTRALMSATLRHRVEHLTTRIRHRAKVLCGVVETSIEAGEAPRVPTNTPKS
jgi:hypothetical protein